MKTKISFVICTYNSSKFIKGCLDSIVRQKGRKEIIVVDGGSTDKTLDIVKSYKNIIILSNPKRLPEGRGFGKWLGWKKARGEFVAMVDHDNILSEDWVEGVIPAFEDKRVFGAASRLKIDKSDSLTNQYVALMGTDPVMAYKSLDGIPFLKEKEFIEVRGNNFIVTGGNCFVYRKEYLDNLGGYTKDVENISKLAKTRNNILAYPRKAETHHLAVSGFLNFLRKKKTWAVSFSGEHKYLETKRERREFIINIFNIFTIVPNSFFAFKQILKTRERAWILHPILAFLTGIIYAIYTKSYMK